MHSCGASGRLWVEYTLKEVLRRGFREGGSKGRDQMKRERAKVTRST